MKYFKANTHLNLRKEPNGELLAVIRENTIAYNVGEPRWIDGILWANILSYGFSGEWNVGFAAVGLDDEIYLEEWNPHVTLRSPYMSNVVYVTQMFGENPNVYSRFGYYGHNGIDLVGVKKQIYAIAPGIVSVGYDANGYGYYVKIEGYSIITIYAHLSEFVVNQNQYIQQGELIGHEGSTGNSSGSHLHLDIRNKQEYDETNGYGGRIDPLPYITQSNLVFPKYADILNNLEETVIINTLR